MFLLKTAISFIYTCVCKNVLRFACTGKYLFISFLIFDVYFQPCVLGLEFVFFSFRPIFKTQKEVEFHQTF